MNAIPDGYRYQTGDYCIVWRGMRMTFIFGADDGPVEIDYSRQMIKLVTVE